MKLTATHLQALRALATTLRSAARTLTELLDDIEPTADCATCNGTGFSFVIQTDGERAYHYCSCGKGQLLAEEHRQKKRTGRDRAAGKD